MLDPVQLIFASAFDRQTKNSVVSVDNHTITAIVMLEKSKQKLQCTNADTYEPLLISSDQTRFIKQLP